MTDPCIYKALVSVALPTHVCELRPAFGRLRAHERSRCAEVPRNGATPICLTHHLAEDRLARDALPHS
jgi:hypothetical protein